MKNLFQKILIHITVLGVMFTGLLWMASQLPMQRSYQREASQMLGRISSCAQGSEESYAGISNLSFTEIAALKALDRACFAQRVAQNRSGVKAVKEPIFEVHATLQLVEDLQTRARLATVEDFARWKEEAVADQNRLVRRAL